MTTGVTELGATTGTGVGQVIQLTTAQRLALTPTNGLLVYDTNFNTLFTFGGGRWFPAQPIDPYNGFIISEDWVNNSAVGNTTWSTTGNSGSATGLLFDANTNAVGQVYLSQTNSSGGYVCIYYGNSYALAGQSMWFDARVKVSVLGNSTDNYIVNVGFGDQVSAIMTEGIYFCYDNGTDGNFWSCKTTSSSTTNKVVTTVAPVAGVYQVLSVAYYGGVAYFYIDNVLVATSALDITTSLVAPKLFLTKTVGSATSELVNDFFTTYSFFTTRRT